MKPPDRSRRSRRPRVLPFCSSGYHQGLATLGRDLLHRDPRAEHPHRVHGPDLDRARRVHGDRRLHDDAPVRWTGTGTCSRPCRRRSRSRSCSASSSASRRSVSRASTSRSRRSRSPSRCRSSPSSSPSSSAAATASTRRRRRATSGSNGRLELRGHRLRRGVARSCADASAVHSVRSATASSPPRRRASRCRSTRRSPSASRRRSPGSPVAAS